MYAKMAEHKKTKWCIPVTKTLDEALEHAVHLDSHNSKSEFVRDAVRRRLEKMGFNPQVFQLKRKNRKKDRRNGVCQ